MAWILLAASTFFIAMNFFLAPFLRLVNLLFVRRTARIPSIVRSVSIIVPAYNEEANIEAKIDSLAASIRSSDITVEVLIGSDGSTDATVARARSCLERMGDERWKIYEFPNEGKCSTLNRLVHLAKGDIVISTDADIAVPTYAVERVIRAFRSDSRTGCLTCVPCFDGQSIGSQRSYWNIEDRIRSAESVLGKLVVVTGMLYAYRRKLFVDIPRGVMADDLWVPLTILLQGHRNVQVDDLRVPYEKTDERTEVERRKRVITGGMDVVRRLWPRLLSHPGIMLLVLFHKVNRWAIPFWLLLFVVAFFLLSPWFVVLLSLAALMGGLLLGRERFLSLAYSGVSPLVSLAQVVRRTDYSRWDHTRKGGEGQGT